MPMGVIDALPTSLAIIGRPGGEWVVLDVAHRLEAIIRANSPLPQPYWTPPSRG
jgi:Asp-tRNA(Asn)/Glu-tRNA(Gln) amidotransferase A subunit family amidase